MEILVFKTNLTDHKDIGDIGPGLDTHPHIIEWNVDLNDCDNVLRVVASNIRPSVIESIIINAGYHCEELH